MFVDAQCQLPLPLLSLRVWQPRSDSYSNHSFIFENKNKELCLFTWNWKCILYEQVGEGRTRMYTCYFSLLQRFTCTTLYLQIWTRFSGLPYFTELESFTFMKRSWNENIIDLLKIKLRNKNNLSYLGIIKWMLIKIIYKELSKL